MWLMLYAFEFMLNHTSFDLFMMWLMFYAFECISCKASMITLILLDSKLLLAKLCLFVFAATFNALDWQLISICS